MLGKSPMRSNPSVRNVSNSKDESRQGRVDRWAKMQTQKISKVRLFCMTQRPNLQMFGVIPFVKLQNDS